MKKTTTCLVISILLLSIQSFSNAISPINSIEIDSTFATPLNNRNCRQSLKGTVYFQSPIKKIKYAIVSLRDSKNNLIEMFHTKGNAKYYFNVKCNKTYTIESYKKEYESLKITINTTSKNRESIVKNLIINSKRKKGGEEVNLMAGTLNFDLNATRLNKPLKYQLNKAIALIKTNPRLIIRFESHTDCRAPKHINEYFSKKRIAILTDYVNSKVEGNRTEGEAFGERKPLNRCVRGVKCSEREHLMNRRTTFVVTERDSIK